MISGDIAKAFKDKKKAMQDTVQKIEEAKVWRRLRTSEHGEILEAWIRAQVAACYSRFAAQDMDLPGFRALQARLRVLQELFQAGHVDDEQIEAWERKVEGLRQELERRQNTGLDRDFSRPAKQD